MFTSKLACLLKGAEQMTLKPAIVHLLSAATMLALPSAFAGVGDWNSGGGYAPNDQFNPWYLPNTETVRYCIEADEANFGLALDQARASIRQALQFWKKEFDQSAASTFISDRPEDLEVRLGTQTFMEEKCDPETDVHIQLGFLSDEQRSKITKPENYLALTVRTSYDPVNLRGKGFIYFAPAAGPGGTVFNPVGDQLWAQNGAINFTIMAIHEFGHVFGVTASELYITRPTLSSYLANPKTVAELKSATIEDAHSEAIGHEVRQYCRDPNYLVNIPGFKKVSCLRLEMNTPADLQKFEGTISYSDDGSVWTPYAKFEGNGYQRDVAAYGHVVLDPAQKVFAGTGGRNIIDTQYFPYVVRVKGTLKPVESQDRIGSLFGREPKPLAATMTVDGPARFSFVVHSWMDNPEWADYEEAFRFHTYQRAPVQ
jgi:hypothetical protein